MKCEECRKIIKKGEGSVTLQSVEKEDFGLKFYVCSKCAQGVYQIIGKIAKT